MAPPDAATDRARTLWVVANGHGEDVIAAALLRELRVRLPAWRFAAFPVVGEGRAFEPLGVPVLGPRRRLPADGLTLHHPSLLWADLRAGLLPTTWAQLRALRAGRVDAVLVVGDVYAQALALLVRAPRRFVVQPLVSVRLAEGGGRVPWNRTFAERIRAPERLLLGRVDAVYPRDEPTASWLRAHGVERARFLGNPMMDGLEGAPWPASRARPTLALLPGSRAYAERSVAGMVAALARLADDGTDLVALVAWTHGAPPVLPPGWSSRDELGTSVWRRGRVEVAWLVGRFGDVLASADAVLGTTGTAQEQAAGLGLPVVSFPVEPAFGRAFLANQQRLLGRALEVVASDPAAIAAGVRRALDDPQARAGAREDGPARLGPTGGTAAIADDVARRLAVAPPTRPSPRARGRPDRP